MNCQQLVELVTDHIDGTLDPVSARRFEAHLETCDGCVAYLEQMRLTLRLLGEIPTGSPDRHARKRLLDAFGTWSTSLRNARPSRRTVPCERARLHAKPETGDDLGPT